MLTSSSLYITYVFSVTFTALKCCIKFTVSYCYFRICKEKHHIHQNVKSVSTHVTFSVVFKCRIHLLKQDWTD